jgi:hypothetical protein
MAMPESVLRIVMRGCGNLSLAMRCLPIQQTSGDGVNGVK